MTKNKGVAGVSKDLFDTEASNALAVSYFETLQMLADARQTKTVDCDLLVQTGEVNNAVYIHGMIDEQQFVENVYLIQSAGDALTAKAKAKFPQTIEVIGVMANKAMDIRAKIEEPHAMRHNPLFNLICVQ